MRNVIFALMAILSLFSCKQDKEERVRLLYQVLDPISVIESYSGIDIYFTQGAEQKVEMEANKSVIDKVMVVSENETLILKRGDFESRRNHEKEEVWAYITAPEITAVNMQDGADFKVISLESEGNFAITLLSGGGFEAGSLDVLGDAIITAGHGADCEIRNLKCIACSLSAMNGADVSIGLSTSGDLVVTTGTSSDVELKGSAKNVTITWGQGADIDISELKYDSIIWK